ncbi:MAG: hypothetical protein IJ731_01360 [Eubacterium sp.]|nr:hypothetical protein [Eubacterium sp.]
MKKITKLFITALSFILIISLMPFSVLAEDGMGSESPVIRAVFRNEDGETAEGDFLTAGNYTVDLTLSGMAAVSAFEITADYIGIDINSVSTIADNNDGFKCGGIKNEDNSFVVILASTGENNTPISDGEAMVTMQVTVNADGDFADFFVVNEDPELTFVQSSYEYGFQAAYVCNSNEATSIYYPTLSYDMSPDLSVKTITVTGTVTVSQDREGSSGLVGIGGIKVCLDGEEIAETASDGSFTAAVPKGTTELTVTGNTIIDRTVTLSGESDVENVNIPVVMCDYAQDGVVNYRDAASFVGYLDEGADYYVYADMNGDGDVNFRDAAVFVDFIADDAVVYDSLSLD